ncbi:MAG: ABC transporter permease [Verrucomicrobia bacterium]|nr:ABC transporter permease [Verrucomicrobiota bacterium]
MTTRRLLLNSIRHYWRTHLGVILGSALAALVLTGALMVGDSVKATLRAQAEARVGKIGEALLCGERFVPWPREVEKRPSVVARTFAPGRDAAGVLMLSGTAARSDGKARANKVQIVGVDDAFWKLSPSGKDPFSAIVAEGNSEENGSKHVPRSGRLPGGAPDSGAVSGDSPETPRSASDSQRTSGHRTSPEVFPAGSPGTALGSSAPPGTSAPVIALNERLAAQLGVKAGDEIRLRMEKPSAISKDAPLSGAEDAGVTITARVARVVGDADFGRFALASGQVPPHTAFVPLGALQEKLTLGAKVNLILNFEITDEELGKRIEQKLKTNSNLRSLVRPSWKERVRRQFSDHSTSSATGELRRYIARTEARNLELAQMDRDRDSREFDNGFDKLGARLLGLYDLEVRELINQSGFEVRTRRIFIEDAITRANRAMQLDREYKGPALPGGAIDSLTYFVNELRAGDGSDAKANATPYSMVTAIDAAASGFVNPKLADDEIQITRWLADDLGVAPGAKVTVRYFVMGERRQLVEKTRTFTVAAPILEMDTPQLQTDADGKDSWMPDFPNVPDKKSFGKWKPGFDFDATRVRKQDEAYWEKYRGTPKAFVTLKTGQELWGNRWGNLTSIRYPAGTKREQVERIAAFIDPAALGFRTVNLREQALAATNAPVDFGELFVYFSFFLIAAAAVLTGLLFTFTIEQRAAEAGLLLAVGWPVKKVRRLFLREGFVLALIGSLAGALLAALYTKGVLHALAGVWGGATGGTRFVFAPSAGTMAIGVVSGVFVALIAMWLASRRLFKMEAAALLNGTTNETNGTRGEIQTKRKSAGGKLAIIAAACVAGAVALAIFAKGNSGAFFGAGALLLIAGCLFALARLRQVAEGTGAESIAQLGARNISRRRGRSLATIAVLASGVFMVIAVDSFRKGAPEDSARRDSGTGGFAFIGESSAPIYEDLNSAKGRDAYALDDKLMSGVRVIQMRVRDGDDASCLNLNRAVQPRLLGVDFSELREKPFGLDWPGVKADGAVPGVVDANTLQWAMRKMIGDVIEYTDERGQSLRVRITATVSGSVLQGLVIIPERDFVAKFPNTAGYRFFLVDCPQKSGEPADKYLTRKIDVRDHLTKQLGDRGLELTPAVKRLAEFNEVENTYLSIFQVLGGLGMLLGSAGLGIVVARNVFERRREFGLLEAVGFTPQTLRRLVFAEHRWLIVGALGIGAVSALTAVWPRLSAQAAHFPWRGILTLLVGMALLGAFWAWLATRLALRRSQLDALRTE